MLRGAKKLRFALDHNFPAPVLKTFDVLFSQVELVAIADIDAGFAMLDDWELFVALHTHRQHWDGLITNDDKLLALEKEMTVLSQTRLTLVVAKGEGDSPIRATGLLLCHLNHICHHSTTDRSQIWRLRVSQKDYEEPRDYLERIAAKKGTTVEQIVRTHRLAAGRLEAPE